MSCITSIKQYAFETKSSQGNCLEQIGNALLSPTRWVIKKHEKSTSSIAEAVLLIAGVFALAIGAIGALFKTLGSCFCTFQSKASSDSSSDSSGANSSESSSSGSTTSSKTNTTGKSLIHTNSNTNKSLILANSNLQLTKKEQCKIEKGDKAVQRFSKRKDVKMDLGKGLMLASHLIGAIPKIKNFEKQAQEFEQEMNHFLINDVNKLSPEDREKGKKFLSELAQFEEALDQWVEEVGLDKLDSGDSGAAMTFDKKSRVISFKNPLELTLGLNRIHDAVDRMFGDMRAITQNNKSMSKACQNMQKTMKDMKNLTNNLMNILIPGISNAVDDIRAANYVKEKQAKAIHAADQQKKLLLADKQHSNKPLKIDHDPDWNDENPKIEEIQ